MHALVILILACGFNWVHGQKFIVNSRSITADQGLPNAQMLCLHEDREGFIWIGTKNGLYRYDGHTFKAFTRENSVLQSNVVNHVFEDALGHLWVVRLVSNRYVSIDILDQGSRQIRRFEDYTGDGPVGLKSITHIHQLRESLLIETADSSHYIMDSGGAFVKVVFPDSFRFIASPAEAEVLGAEGDGFVIYDLSGGVLHRFRLPGYTRVTDAVKDFRGDYWCTVGNWVATENVIEVEKLVTFRPASGIDEVVDIEATNFDARLFSMRGGQSILLSMLDEVLEFDLETQRTYRNTGYGSIASLPWGHIVIKDGRDALWIGATSGLYIISFEQSNFSSILADRDPPLATRGIARKNDDILVNGMNTGWFVHLPTGDQRSYSADIPALNDPGPFPAGIMPDGRLYVASHELVELDETFNISRISATTTDGKKRVWSFCQDSEGRFWLGRGVDELVVIDGTDFSDYRLFNQYNGIEEAQADLKWHFFEDGAYIWISAENGLFLVHKERGVIGHFGADQEGVRYLPAAIFHYMFKDRDGTYWLATGDGGLIRFDYDHKDPESATFKQFKLEDGLPSLDLYAILEDDRGWFWVSSSNGLIHFDPTSETCRVYFEEQGITHNEFNRLSYYKDGDGRIYFGGLNGVNIFDPADFEVESEYTAPLILASADVLSFGSDQRTDVRVDILEDRKLVILPRDNFLTLRFSLQDYFYQDMARYSYRIKGVQEDWIPMEDNVLQLAGMPFGSHDLEVRAMGRMNRFSKDVFTMELKVLPPLYLRGWFIALALLTLVTTVWQYINWRTRALRRRKMALERMVTSRTKKIQQDKKLIEEQALQLRELDKMKSRFYENISHELRTPLTLIRGPLEKVLKANKLENRDFTLLMLMRDNVQRLHKRINELLDLSSMDAVKMALNPEPVHLYEFVRRILAQFEGGARVKGVHLVFTYDLNESLRVMVDPNKLEKILYNLLSNAIKFTPEDGKISLTCGRNQGMLVFEVEDTGIGIAAGDLEQIFDRFYQTSKDEYYEGTGIGLALCKEFVELMGGTIGVSSVPGEGSTFRFRIPLEEIFTADYEDADELGTDLEETATVASAANGLRAGDRVLVVEDNASLRDFLKIILEDFDVRTAGHGKAALGILESGFKPAVIVSDIMMPVMDGIELLKTIRADDRYRTIPVIMLTAKSGTANKVEALRIGVDDYLTKPFVEEELIARLQAIIHNSRNRMGSTGGASKSKPEAETLNITESDLKWIKEVESIILEHVGDTMFGIDQLAEKLNMTTRRIQQKIKSIVGLTPKQYQREIQLEAARRMLESGAFQSVAEVSRQIGFSDSHYFSRIYEKRFGKRPSAYF